MILVVIAHISFFILFICVLSFWWAWPEVCWFCLSFKNHLYILLIFSIIFLFIFYLFPLILIISFLLLTLGFVCSLWILCLETRICGLIALIADRVACGHTMLASPGLGSNPGATDAAGPGQCWVSRLGRWVPQAHCLWWAVAAGSFSRGEGQSHSPRFNTVVMPLDRPGPDAGRSAV